MNLDNNPTVKQLRELLARCDDRAGNHVVWVTRNGNVVVSMIQHPRVDVRSIEHQPAAVKLQQDHPEMQLRCETFLKGNRYVGPDAETDDDWLRQFLDLLKEEWQQAKGRPDVVYLRVSDGSRIT